MKQYKVIKDFSSARKGDIFEENEEGIFEMEHRSYCNDVYNSRTMYISSSIASSLSNEGFLEEIEEKSFAEEKLNSISNFISEMKKQYKEDYNNLIDEYNEGNLPTCVKTEADTVYFNMNKLLTKIEELINE